MMLVNVYIRNGDDSIRIKQVKAETIPDAMEMVCRYLEDNSEVIFGEDNLHPKCHGAMFVVE